MLEITIVENKNAPIALLNGRKLTCEDMQIVDYYLLRNNKVKQKTSFFPKMKIYWKLN